jgi:hypothetical protein
MRRRHVLGPGVALALAAATVAVGGAGWSLARALRVERPPRPAAASADSSGTVGPIFAGVSAAVIAEAIDSDPFRPERRRPEVRFRLPGEQAPPTVTQAGSASAAQLRLIGTVVSPEGGGFAMCQFGAEAPKVVRVGERIGPYALVDVHQGRARFRSEAGEIVDVTVAKAGD